MHPRLRICLLAAALLLATLASAAPARAAEPIAIRWEQLIPAARAVGPAELMARLRAPAATTGHAAVSVSPRADLVGAYDGAAVRITGFALPFNNEEPPYKRLLLIPFSDACVKFPPPRNQAILLGFAQGVALTEFMYPMTVTGTMTVAPEETEIAEAGYRIDVETIAPAY